MKLTNKQLEQIIKEELDNFLHESRAVDAFGGRMPQHFRHFNTGEREPLLFDTKDDKWRIQIYQEDDSIKRNKDKYRWNIWKNVKNDDFYEDDYTIVAGSDSYDTDGFVSIAECIANMEMHVQEDPTGIEVELEGPVEGLKALSKELKEKYPH